MTEDRSYSITITTDGLVDNMKAIGTDMRTLASDLNPLPSLRLLGNKQPSRPEDDKTVLAEHMTTLTVVEPLMSGVRSVSNFDYSPYYASGIGNDLYREVMRESILSDGVGLIAEHQNSFSSAWNTVSSEMSGSVSRELNTMHINRIGRRQVIFISIMILIIVLYKYFFGK